MHPKMFSVFKCGTRLPRVASGLARFSGRNFSLQPQAWQLLSAMGAHQLVKTTASVSNYNMIIEALAGPSTGSRLIPKYITKHFKIHAAEEAMGLVQQFEMPASRHIRSHAMHSLRFSLFEISTGF